MADFIANLEEFFVPFIEWLERFFDSIKEGWEFINSAIELPLELVSLVPPVLGASITIVLFVMILKLILGR